MPRKPGVNEIGNWECGQQQAQDLLCCILDARYYCTNSPMDIVALLRELPVRISEDSNLCTTTNF